jgi:hypothetical protein
MVCPSIKLAKRYELDDNANAEAGGKSHTGIHRQIAVVRIRRTRNDTLG